MFKQLSQIGKNLSDEFAKGLADDLNSAQDAPVDDNSGLPADVQAKLRKFEKYEEKYPRLLAAYKNEKIKIEKLAAVERVLAENTPVSSFEDVESLSAFFKDMKEKQTMLNNEIKRLTSLSTVRKENEEAQGAESNLADGQKNEKYMEEELEELRSKLRQTEEKHKEEVSVLRKQLKVSKEESVIMKEKSESLVQEHTEETSKLKQELSASKDKSTGTLDEVAPLQSQKEAQEPLKKLLEDANALVTTKQNEIENLEEQIRNKQEYISKLENASHDKSTTSASPSNMRTAKNYGKKKNKNKKKKGITGSQSVSADDASELISTTTIEEQSSEIRELLAQIEELKHTEKLTEGWEAKCEALKSELEILKESKIELQNNCDNSKCELDLVKGQLLNSANSLREKKLELEELRDMLRSVGNELVEAKEEMKNSSGIKQEDMEKLRNDNASMGALFESKERELTATIETLRKETLSLKSELSSSVEQKKITDKSLASLNEALKKLKSENLTLLDQLKEHNSLKKTYASLRASVLQKEKTITYLEQQVKEYSGKADLTKTAVDNMKKENYQLIDLLETSRREKETLSADAKKNSLSLENYIKENGKLSERLTTLHEKYESLQNLKSNSHEQADSIKRQCEELNSKLKEANKRIISLEDEVSDYAKTVQDKIREAHVMRRLLSENANEETTKERELKENLAFFTDENTKLKNELTLQASRKTRELHDWKQANVELQSEIHALKLREKQLLSEIATINSLNDSIQRKNFASEDDSTELEKLSSHLKEALSKADKKIRDLQATNGNLMRINDDVNKKLDRLSKNYKTLLNQLSSLKEEKNGTSTRSSRSSSIVSTGNGANLPTPEPRRSHSFSKEIQITESQSELNEKVAYIKNVLLGFLEHKEQRNQLLPVMSMLLRLDSNDEKRLLMSLR